MWGSNEMEPGKLLSKEDTPQVAQLAQALIQDRTCTAAGSRSGDSLVRLVEVQEVHRLAKGRVGTKNMAGLVGQRAEEGTA